MSYLALVPGGPDAGQVDGLVVPRVELHHQGVGVDHLHHLEEGGRRDRLSGDQRRIKPEFGLQDQ